MRITLLAPLVTPLLDRQLGGSQTVVTELARGLGAAGDDVDLVAARGSRVTGVRLRRLREGPFPEALFPLGEPASGASVDTWPALQAPAYLRLAAALRADPAEVVHNHGQDWPVFYALAATGLPIVHTIHLPPVDASAVAAATAAASCRPRNAWFVAPSRACARLWRGLVPVDAVIPNGLEPDSVPFSATPEPDLAVVAGRISPEKGTHLALEAIRRCGMRALVAGPVYDRAYHDAEVVPRLGEGARWIGPVSRRRLARLYGRAAVTVLAPQWEEPFGLVALESNLAGTPVAGFARGGLPEVVGPRGGVLIEAATTAALAGAARAAASLDRGAVRRAAVRRHSLAAMVDRHRVLYVALRSGGASAG